MLLWWVMPMPQDHRQNKLTSLTPCERILQILKNATKPRSLFYTFQSHLNPSQLHTWCRTIIGLVVVSLCVLSLHRRGLREDRKRKELVHKVTWHVSAMVKSTMVWRAGSRSWFFFFSCNVFDGQDTQLVKWNSWNGSLGSGNRSLKVR